MCETVLSLGSGAGGGFVKATVLKHLQPLQFLRILFVNFLRWGIQCFSLTFAIVRPIPPWIVATCARWTTFDASRTVSGRCIGYWPWIRPRNSSTPSSLGCRFGRFLSWSKVELLFPWFCAFLTKTISCLAIPIVFKGPLTLLQGFREFFRNRRTHAPILKALGRTNLWLGGWFVDGGLSTVKGKLKWYAGEKWFDVERY